MHCAKYITEKGCLVQSLGQIKILHNLKVTVISASNAQVFFMTKHDNMRKVLLFFVLFFACVTFRQEKKTCSGASIL
jgi:hypothetical protein